MSNPADLPDDASDGPASFASERVADHLRQMILDDRLLPGERIRQDAVAEELGASRLPVREALRILEAEGLTVLKANTGASVSRLDFAECEAIYKLRERVEPLVLAESIPNLGDDAIDELDRIQAGIEAATDLATFLSLDRNLHLLTYSGCRIPSSTTWCSASGTRPSTTAAPSCDCAAGRTTWSSNTADHVTLIDAIRRRDIEDAEQVLAAHIRRTRKELSHHPEIFDTGLTKSTRRRPPR